LPPSNGFIPPFPSAVLFPNKYTYFPAFSAFVALVIKINLMFARYKLEKLQKKRAANLAKTLAMSTFDSSFQVNLSGGNDAHYLPWRKQFWLCV
jgi:hypothetical protein